MRCVFVISLLLDTNPQCRNVSIWHLADIQLLPIDVRFWG